MRRAVVLAFFASVAACSSSETDAQLNPQPLPPQDEGARSPSTGSSGGGNVGACSGTCCDRPAEGTTCDASADTTCSWAVTCPTGLVLPYEVTCTGGTWKLTNGCPADGDVDERGCPASQPQNGTACALPQNNFSAQCGYVRVCEKYRESALATCSGGVWQTTALGECK